MNHKPQTKKRMNPKLELICFIIDLFLHRLRPLSFSKPDLPPSVAFGVIVDGPYSQWVYSFSYVTWEFSRRACIWGRPEPVELCDPIYVHKSNLGDLLGEWLIRPGIHGYRVKMGGINAYASCWTAEFAAARAAARGETIRPELIEWLSRRYGIEMLITADGHLCDADEAVTCDLSDCVYSNHANMITYYSRNGWREIENIGHADLVEEQCFYCDHSSEWFLSDDFTSVDVDGDTVCAERNQDEIYYWESDSEYHWEPEPECSDWIPAYHDDANRRFKSRAVSMQGAGIELEVYAPHPLDLWQHVSSYDGLCGEIDPSLASGESLEIITLPHTLAEWRDSSPDLLHALRTFNGGIVGHDAGEDYAIHVSLSRSLFPSNLVLGKYIVAINQMACLGRLVAQRPNSYNGGFKCRFKVTEYNTGKYEPVKTESGRIETRIFRSNLRPERIRAKIEYCFAVLEWSKNESCAIVADERKATNEFLSFLSRPGNRKTYPNLCRMIAEKADELFALGESPITAARRLVKKEVPVLVEI